jgi:hypothetical protein
VADDDDDELTLQCRVPVTEKGKSAIYYICWQYQ